MNSLNKKLEETKQKLEKNEKKKNLDTTIIDESDKNSIVQDSKKAKKDKKKKIKDKKKNKYQDTSSDALVSRTQTEIELAPTEREKKILEYRRLFEEANKENITEEYDRAMIHRSGVKPKRRGLRIAGDLEEDTSDAHIPIMKTREEYEQDRQMRKERRQTKLDAQKEKRKHKQEQLKIEEAKKQKELEDKEMEERKQENSKKLEEDVKAKQEDSKKKIKKDSKTYKKNA